MAKKKPAAVVAAPVIAATGFPEFADNDMFTAKPKWIHAAGAAELLAKYNHGNRPFKEARAEKYKNLHLVGKWNRNMPLAIILDDEGNMQNGQHSLTGFVRAEAERAANPDQYAALMGTDQIMIAAVLIQGIPADAADLIDIPDKRTHADVIYRKKLFGYGPKGSPESNAGKEVPEWSVPDLDKMSKMLGTASKIVFFRTVHNAKVRSSIKFDHPTMLQTLDLNPGLATSVAFVYGIDQECRKGDKFTGLTPLLPNLAYAAAAHYLAAHSKMNEDWSGKFWSKANTFFTQIAQGKGEENSPVKLLTTYLARENKKSKTGEDLNRIYDALVIGWNAFIDEKHQPLKPKSPFNVKADLYVCMGGLDELKPETPTEVAAPGEVPTEAAPTAAV